MKRSRGLYIFNAILIGIALMAFGSGPASAQSQETKIGQPFSVDENDPGYQLPVGSTVLYLPDGITKVLGPNNAQVVLTKDADAPIIQTPGGQAPATHVIQVPSGSRVDRQGTVTTISSGGTRILTIVDQGNSNKIKQPSYPPSVSGWVESANNWSISALDYFQAWWLCPSAPPNPASNVVNYIFNAIEPSVGGAIVQPVLEWNYGGSGRWTGASWCGSGGYYVRATPGINVSYADSINGTMQWEKDTSGFWTEQLYDGTTGASSVLETNDISTDQNLAVFVTLEAYNIQSDNDICGEPLFDHMIFKHGSNGVTFTWGNTTDNSFPLTDLYVYVYSQSKVLLEDAN